MPSNKPCSYDGCTNRQHARGYCDTHDRQYRRTGRMWPAGHRYASGCRFHGCEGKKHHARGYCEGHYTQLRLGKTLTALVKPRREVRFPAQPVREVALALGVSSPVRSDRLWLTLEEADEVCVKVFKVHPFFVYGDAWWDDKEMEEAA